MKKFLVSTLLMFAAAAASAQTAVDTLKDFVRDVKSGRAEFTQTVTSPDGAKKKTSSGKFEFSRPNRFRFTYLKPFEQVIVADGQKVWIYDADLNQASSRKFSQALGATPAALLAGGSLEKDFDLAAQPAKDGLDWVEATPKAKEGSFKSVRVGFKGKTLSAIEVVDAFNQRSLLQFSQFVANEPIKAETFVFTVPKGADLIEQ
ncbi:outer membrane lipoprotein chaperone LolA [Piscinibacter gummiphilus]|uniref:Outer-membrane lipoprotein carrier protein n=1 Tax=Piscinibacter gummiphilus TaxID=946333 RepID=A0ABZ0CXF8_9BURK|nr:outer membrane lipoprotein chaperone LolA [Piscinibacter gummiphilus]WOB09634.1 outer membrane lipoprotein chaperone LolA [Piscinibacter gummiphilus]